MRRYLRTISNEVEEQGIKQLGLKAVKNPKAILGVSNKYYHGDRYLDEEWDKEEALGNLSKVLDAERDELESILSELSNSDQMIGVEDILENSEYRENPAEFGYRKLFYVITRYIKPEVIVETGVFDGVGTSFFLMALEKNGKGRLISIDYTEGGMSFPPGEECGWAIPEKLRERWELVEGRSVNKLEKVLKNYPEADLFFHDSKHSYTNMMIEYKTSMRFLDDFYLLSDDINFNSAFDDFKEFNADKVKISSNLRDLGVIKIEK